MILLLVTIIFVLISYKLYKTGQYWKNKGVAHEPYFPIVGSTYDLFFKNKNVIEVFLEVYNKYPEKSYFGMYQFSQPVLIVKDLESIKNIGIRDFDHFTDHLDFVNPESEPIMSKSLFSKKGQEWKDMRGSLSPAFTSSKMKNMFKFMNDCAKNLTKHYETNPETVTVSVKDVFTRFSNDIIATTAFGIQVDSFANPNNDFYLMGKRITTISAFTGFLIFVYQTLPKFVIKTLNLRVLDKGAVSYFENIIREAISKRENGNVIRPDILHLLIEAKKGKLRYEADNEDAGFATVQESEIGKSNINKWKWTDYDIVALCFNFFFGGFDTVSSGACFMAYELAVNPDVQQKLQKEIDGIDLDELTYETLLKMKYLDQVVSEVLRKWPPLIFTDRLCTKDYTLDSGNGKDKLTIKKGQIVNIPIICIHRDSNYYPDPEKFDPERFSAENKDKLVSGSYWPFGIGPRNCIGSRFALMEIKVLMVHLLSKFDLVPVKETQIPYRVPARRIISNPDDLKLGLRLRKTTCN